jgi:hypothetical protein
MALELILPLLADSQEKSGIETGKSLAIFMRNYGVCKQAKQDLSNYTIEAHSNPT